MGPVPLEAASHAAAGLPGASRLLLEHVNGVFVLHLQLAGSTGQAQQERGKLLVSRHQRYGNCSEHRVHCRPLTNAHHPPHW